MAGLDGALTAHHPSNFSTHPMMIACAAIILDDAGGLLLVCNHFGFWSGVGGWVEKGERPEDAVLREVREELGVEAEVIEVLHPYMEWQAFNADDNRGFLLFSIASAFFLTISPCSPRRSWRHAGLRQMSGLTCL